MTGKTLGTRNRKRKKKTFSWSLNFTVTFKLIKHVNGNIEDNLKYLNRWNFSWRDFHSSAVITQCFQQLVFMNSPWSEIKTYPVCQHITNLLPNIKIYLISDKKFLNTDTNLPTQNNYQGLEKIMFLSIEYSSGHRESMFSVFKIMNAYYTHFLYIWF